MKGRAIALHDLRSPKEAMQRILCVRFAEVLAQSSAFGHSNANALHDLRIACKRLRYALELFGDAVRDCLPAERSLAALQQELGEAHDCDVLLHSARKCRAIHLAKRIQRDRERCVRRAKRIWTRSIGPSGAFAQLLAFTGIGSGKN